MAVATMTNFLKFSAVTGVTQDNKKEGAQQEGAEKSNWKWLGWVGGFLAFVCVFWNLLVSEIYSY